MTNNHPSKNQMTTIYDFRKAALDLAAANNSLGRAIYRLDYLDKVGKDAAIECVKIERKKVFACQRKIWFMNRAEDAMSYMTDDLHDEMIEWLKGNNIIVTPSCATPEIVLLAIENGWDLFPEPPDSDSAGEPPLTAREMLENARKQKNEAWRS